MAAELDGKGPGEKACEAALRRLQAAHNRNAIGIADRVPETHYLNFISNPDKSYILPKFDLDKVINSVIKSPCALLQRRTVEDQKWRYVLEADFTDVIGVTNEVQRTETSRIQIIIGEPSAASVPYMVISLRVLAAQDPDEIHVSQLNQICSRTLQFINITSQLL